MSNKNSVPGIARALISVSDKTNLDQLGHFLIERHIDILATGGTAKYLQECGLPITDLTDYTGFPEILDGRIKSLHPKIHAGLLARHDQETHLNALRQHNIDIIDLVIVNLYPFADVVRRDAGFDTCLEMIDIGGPTLIRAAAKNHEFTTVIVDPNDYSIVMNDIATHHGNTTLMLRRQLAQIAFQHCAAYDAHIAQWFSAHQEHHDGAQASLPHHLLIAGQQRIALRYGENPHQSGGIYVDTKPQRPGVATAIQVQGKDLSYNNINDADAAYELIAEFTDPAVALVKHTNPCGVAESETLVQAYRHALAGDPISAYGSIVAANCPLDEETAAEICKLFVEVVIVPDASPQARTLLKSRKNLRLLIAKDIPNPKEEGLLYRSVAGGWLVQGRDTHCVKAKDLKVMSQRHPTQTELQDLLFAYKVCKHVMSNAIVFGTQSYDPWYRCGPNE